MKTLSTKIIAAVFVIALATGCSSIADAGLAEQPTDPTIEQVTPPAPDVDPINGGIEATPIVEKPML